MDRKVQEQAMDTFAERMEEHANRVMSVPTIRETVTKRSDEKYKDAYVATTRKVQYA